MNENPTAAPAASVGETPVYRPKLTFYHPNARGTGCAAQFELHPAQGDLDGSIWLCAANQMTVGDRRGPNPTYPRFDWENRLIVKLDFNDLCKILQVFRGECESIDDGRGLYHTSAKASTRIVLRHVLEPMSGYSLEIYRTARSGGEESSARIFFSPAEALGLCESIAGSMSVLVFGVPQDIPRTAPGALPVERTLDEAAA